MFLLEVLIPGSGTHHSVAMQRISTMLLMSVFSKLGSLCMLFNAEKMSLIQEILFGCHWEDGKGMYFRNKLLLQIQQLFLSLTGRYG